MHRITQRSLVRPPRTASMAQGGHPTLQVVSMFLVPWLLLIYSATCQGQDDSAFRFKKHLINAESEFSAATAVDVNGDGRLDIVCGAYWYEAPDWQPHRFRKVEMIRGRFDDYANLPLDVDGDGLLDIISVNYRSQSLYWCRNPGEPDTNLWEKQRIDRPGPSETGRLVDIDGDGQLDVLPNGMNYAAWYQIARDGDQVQWIRHDLPEQLAGHGIGAGDINGDGRVDIVSPSGWAESIALSDEAQSESHGRAEDMQGIRWRWRPEFQLASDCGLPILCHDVDGDGDTDLIWARGHGVGLYWTEQVAPETKSMRLSSDLDDAALPDGLARQIAQTGWITHPIDTSWACGHTLMLADIDGDGRQEVVTGKRYQGHDGKDRGENDPLTVRWYDFQTESDTWQANLISMGGACGIDLDSACVDLDGDGDLDILAPSRSGLHWLENLMTNESQVEPSPVVEPILQQVAYDEHDDFTYYLDASGEAIPLETPLDHGIRRHQILEQLQLVMGDLPSAQQRVPLDTVIDEVVSEENYHRVKLSYTAEPGVRVPAYLLVPKEVSEPAAAMLCLHPTHFELGKAQICGLGGRPSRFYAHELAEAGYICLAPDYPGFGDYEYDFAAHQERYASGTMKAIWDNLRAVDLLETLPCVDRDRIGVIGHSLGGHNALFTAAFDQRLKCVVTSCGFTTFADYYEGDLEGWTSTRYMPRIAERFGSQPEKVPFDFPEVLAAIAPRRVFINAPEHDSNFAVRGVRKCQRALEPLEGTLKDDELMTFVYPDAEHDFPESVRQQAYRWLDNELRY